MAFWLVPLVMCLLSIYVLAHAVRSICCKSVKRIGYIDDGSIVVLTNPAADPSGNTWGIIIRADHSLATTRVTIRSAGKMGAGIYELKQFTTNPRYTPTTFLYDLTRRSASHLEADINDYLIYNRS